MAAIPLSRRGVLVAVAALATLSSAEAGQSPSPTPGPDDLWIGHDGAAVDLVEYLSLSCPYCAAFALDVWPVVKRSYVDTGSVRFSMRDLPDTPQAGYAAVALRLASGAEGRLEGAELLFRRRDDWVQSADVKGAIADVMGGLGVTRASLDAAWADRALHQSVLDSRQRGVELGVNRLPGLIANGKLSLGAMSAYDTGAFLVGAAGR